MTMALRRVADECCGGRHRARSPKAATTCARSRDVAALAVVDVLAGAEARRRGRSVAGRRSVALARAARAARRARPAAAPRCWQFSRVERYCTDQRTPMTEYKPQQLDKKWQQQWTADARVRGRRRSGAAEVLLPRDVRVPVRARARRPRPQLHHRRRHGAHEADARLQRAASVRLGRVRPAGRERRHQDRHASRRRRRSTTSPT